MSKRLSLEEIRQFWTSQAQAHGQSPAASWSDEMVIDLEIREIVARLHDGESVLDVGCANGFSTVQFARHKQVSVRGLDYVPDMIAAARQRLAGLSGQLLGSVVFDVGDITALKEADASYDTVVVIRVVINLHDWPRQLQALRECSRVLKPGGRLLLSEATLQGWQRLNQFRREWLLADIPMPAFNLYVDEDLVTAAVAPELELVELVNFASTYYVGSRVIKPLLAQTLSSAINVADPLMEFNRWFAQLPAAGDYGTQKLFVFRKKSA
jgi:ubiquinone/menaquinone biosynthesis C-methylase UbiE